MRISGFQKLTLLDFPEHVAATVFTGGCNLRCPFCHNALLVTGQEGAKTYSEKEIFSYINRRVKILDGVCISGGEPLMQPDIADFMKKIKDMGLAVKLDTNGTYPQKLRALVEAGLVDYVAMDIKNSRRRYAETAGASAFDIEPIEESVSLLLSGIVDYEFRTTVVRELHTLQDIEEIARWISGAKRYFLQNFVDSGNIIGKNLNPHSPEKLETMRSCAAAYVDMVSVRGI